MKRINPSKPRGVALVLVLAFLALISVFIIGFFSAASGELTASSSFAATITTRQLADSTTELVKGQIRAATTRISPSAADTDRDLDAWASQPGAIRCFKGGPQASPKTTAIYKLYSATAMTIDGEDYAGQFKSDSDLPDGPTWVDQPAIFVDLNEPVAIVNPSKPGENMLRYPVFDPGVFSKPGEPSAAAGSINPTDFKIPGAELTPDASLANRPGRMPVRWLYVLRDGTVVSPNKDAGEGGKSAIFDPNKEHPTPENPIVGRIAFWTDDDTCRVNINTAGGFNPQDVKNLAIQPGSYWDTPRLWTAFDRGVIDSKGLGQAPMSLALSQPSNGEFQRYPGHPSTTSLGLVLSSVLKTSNEVYNLTPRLLPSGRNAKNMVAGSNNGLVQTRAEKDAAMPTKYDRLYSSVDEMQYSFSPEQAAWDTKKTNDRGAGQRLRQFESQPTAIQPETLDRLRFFLTAHSRAPELNLFGRPRISLWPMWPVFGTNVSYKHFKYSDTSSSGIQGAAVNYTADDFRKLMNPSDRLLAFCSMIGSGLTDPYAKAYMFQRYDPYSSTNDWQIPRNKKLLEMLNDLVTARVPGYNGAFSDTSKYGTDAQQVVTEMFDYIRCVNLRDSTHDDPPNFDPEPPQDLGYEARRFKYAPRGVVVPSVIDYKAFNYNKTAGFGRFPGISEVGIDFYHAGYVVVNKPALDRFEKGEKDPATGKLQLKPHQEFHFDRTDLANYYTLGKMIGCFIMIETFNPMQGYSAIDSFDATTEVRSPNQFFFVHEISGLDQFAMASKSSGWTYQSFQMPANASNAYYATSAVAWGGRNTGGSEGFAHPFAQSQTQFTSSVNTPLNALKKSASNTASYWYPFQSTPTGGGFELNPNTALPVPGSADKGEQIAIDDLGQINPATQQFVKLKPNNGIVVRPSDKTMKFRGGKITLKVRWGPESDPGKDPINTYELIFPGHTDAGGSMPDWPMPTDNIWEGGPKKALGGGRYDTGGVLQSADNKNPSSVGSAGWTMCPKETQFFFWRRVWWSIGRDLNNRSQSYDPYDATKQAKDPVTQNQVQGMYFGRRWRQMLQPGDTLRSLVPAVPDLPVDQNGHKEAGDPRVLAMVGPDDPQKSQYFVPHPDYRERYRHAQTLRAASGQFYITAFETGPAWTGSPSIGEVGAKDPEDAEFLRPTGFPRAGFEKIYSTMWGQMVKLPTVNYYSYKTASDLPGSVKGVWSSMKGNADFDTGTGPIPDGAYTGKPDEGTYTWKIWDSTNLKYLYTVPYFQTNVTTSSENSFGSYFTPNRQIPSAVAFGSLLTGRKKHWQTLAFSPNPADPGHPGISKDPKDHVLLDFFTMPVVEPYAISEPFSTAGKININYPVVPFTYIKRTTGLRAVLAAVRVTALTPDNANRYKNDDPNALFMPQSRHAIDIAPKAGQLSAMDKTVQLFDEFLANKGSERIFHSASQVCEVYLAHANYTGAATSKAMATYWATQTLTADNMREKPYADIYPRVTTKSNTYTVYMRVQTLRKRPLVGGSDAAKEQFNLQWNEGQDQVLAEYRGSTTIERYLDPQEPRIADPSRVDYIDGDKKSLEPFYRFRAVESKRFAPQ